ncbi:MAG: methylmalonyl-CoA epimerase [Actinobacteria bacterium]|nr:methylmalonyl-CoA epimerase [Actinomycetota bacterium]
MIGRLNHVAIAVPDLKVAIAAYRDVLGADVSEPSALPEHGVTVSFVTLPNTKVELLEPLGGKSPILSFLEKNRNGGIHHLCFEVSDIEAALEKMTAEGKRVLGKVRTGAHGRPVVFVHPGDFQGTLIELEQV